MLYAGGDGKMISVDAKSGEQLWDASFPNSGYQSPQDLMVVDGLVWLAPLTSGKDSGVYTGRDPKTGEVKKEFRARCRYLLVSSSLLHRQGDRQFPDAVAHRHRICRSRTKNIGTSITGFVVVVCTA